MAASTVEPHRIEIVERAEPADPPPPGHVLLRLEAVGVCGSDAHIFDGDVAALSGAEQTYPRVQGHEISASVVSAVTGDRYSLDRGDRVAVWPLTACGQCYPCRSGRLNVCTNLRLVGVHHDGGFQQLLTVPSAQVFPAGDVPPEVAAFAEPTSIAVHTVRRARLVAGESVVVLGAGAIGQAVCLAAVDLGARAMVVDPVASRRALAEAVGASETCWGTATEVAAAARAFNGGNGPPVIVDATGSPEALGQALDMVSPAGRVVVVGMSAGHAPVRSGVLPAKEIDVLGVSCCDGAEFGTAVDLVRRRAATVERLISHRIPLAEAGRAIELAVHPDEEVMKVVVALGE